MFARHTPTRMRVSGVVQSLKSLASKLHPQLPLSPKESQRLLTALTSSFREKLDQAHPPRAQDEHNTPTVDLKSGHHALHTSSVAFADKHLASILTNPLLAKSDGAKKPALNLETAQRELETNPDKDPIAVLEEYHRKGAATLLIANLCLRAFIDSLRNLSTDDRQAKVAKTRAGLRTLQWLWTSELFADDEFANDRRLLNVLVAMIREEKEEHFLWSWLRMDQCHAIRKDASGIPQYTNPRFPYRWKDFLIRTYAMQTYDASTSPVALNDVFDVYFKALDTHLEVAQNYTGNCVPTSGTEHAIRMLIFADKQHRKSWDVNRYDRFIDEMDFHNSLPWKEFNRARLMLTHPRNPSPLPMLKFLDKPASHQAEVWTSITKDRDSRARKEKIRLSKYFILVETVKQLKAMGHAEDGDWVVSQIVSLFPENDRYLAENMGAKPAKFRLAHPDPMRLPFPTLSGSGAT